MDFEFFRRIGVHTDQLTAAHQHASQPNPNVIILERAFPITLRVNTPSQLLPLQATAFQTLYNSDEQRLQHAKYRSMDTEGTPPVTASIAL